MNATNTRWAGAVRTGRFSATCCEARRGFLRARPADSGNRPKTARYWKRRMRRNPSPGSSVRPATDYVFHTDQDQLT